MEFENYPKIEDVIQSISKLNKIGFPKFNGEIEVDKFVEIVSKILTNEFGILPNYLKLFKHNEFNLKFFRAREIDTISNINLIREHSYPPINFVGMGRCNFPKFPVFYCSDNPMTAILEVVRDNNGRNRKYCISKWELNDSDEQLVFQSFLQVDLPNENLYNSLKENLKKNINTPFIKSLNQKLDKDIEEGVIEYLKYLDTSFIVDNDYSLSASLAHRSLYADHTMRTDILMYPSKQTFLKGVNLALNPNFVENNLKLTRLYMVELDNYNPKKNEVSLIFSKYAEVKKNIISWKIIQQNDEYYKKIIKKDFGDKISSEFKEVELNK